MVAGGQSQEKAVLTEAGFVVHFEDGGGTAAKGYRWLLEAEKDKEVNSPLRGSRRNQLC